MQSSRNISRGVVGFCSAISLVTLTQLGRDYAHAITAVIEELNREVAGRVGPAELAAADTVLRAALFDESTRQRATRLPPPPGQPSAGGAVLAGH